MARKKQRARMKRLSVVIKRYLAKTGQTEESYRRELAESNLRPTYGKGSRGPTRWAQTQSSITLLAEQYDLKRSEINSARGLARRINNVMKLVQKDDSIASIMEHRWKTSDLYERYGYRDFKDLSQSEIAGLVDIYLSEGGIMSLPSLTAPSGESSNQWES
jgi:hypothetical protein